MDGQTIDIGLGENQIFTFPTDLVGGNDLPLILDTSSISSIPTISEGNVIVDENGIAYLSIPIQIVQDVPQQSNDLLQDSKNTISPIVYIDSSQLALLSNNQEFIISNTPGNALTNRLITLNTDENDILGTSSSDKQTLINLPGLVEGIDISNVDLSSLCINPNGGFNVVLSDKDSLNLEISNAAESGSESTENVVLSSSSKLLDIFENEKEAPSEINSGIEPDDIVEPPVRKGPFKCLVCCKEFAAFQTFNVHQRSHRYEKPFKCTNCPASFNHVSNLSLHEVLHLKNAELRCPECKKKFNRLASLKAHITVHEKEEVLCCSECGDEFHSQFELDEHSLIHEAEWLSPKSGCQCKQCGRHFNNAGSLRDHMKDHYKLKRMLSPKKYSRSAKKKAHNQCDICQKAFQKPSQLLRHRRIHTGERPYKCGVCSRAFTQKGSLKIHMLKHNGKKPYKCFFCSAAFSQKGNLRCHVLRLHSIPHTEETTFECDQCSCVFRKIGSLNAHINRAHKNSKSDESVPPRTTSRTLKQGNGLGRISGERRPC